MQIIRQGEGETERKIQKVREIGQTERRRERK